MEDRNRTRWGKVGLAAVALVLALAALAGGDGGTLPVYAASLVVNTLADNTTTNGQCSLREAMTNAINAVQTFPDCPAGGNSDTITFAVSGTITLGSQLPSVVGNIFFLNALEIDGTGQNIVISGNNAVRHFDIAVVSRLTLKNLTLTNGRLAALSSIARGGSITNAGTLIVRNSTFTGNTATTAFSSGAASAGAIAADGGSVTEIYNSTFTNNTATATSGLALSSSGGAISIAGSGVPGSLLIVDSSTFNSNSTTGGVSAGGAIAVGTGTFTVDIVNSTFSGNTTNTVGLFSGGGGGAITLSAGLLEVIHSTLSGNTATGAGAQGGGIRQTGGVATLTSSVLANAGPAGTPECSGTIGTTALTIVNLAQAAVPGCVLAGAIIGVPAGLGPLANNGGPTLTHALLAGSPAINVASPLICSSAQVANKDQRGVTRPQGAACDLGAFEAQVGGKNLKISAPGPAINLTWDAGTLQADYVVARAQLIPAGGTVFSPPLPANATSFNDPAPPASSLLCYQVVARDGVGVTLGLSDLDCGYTGFGGGTVIPGAFTLGLNQSANASLTWTAPAGGPVDGYALYKLPFDGSPITFEALGAGALSSVQNMGATHYCYTLVAFRGAAFGNTNLVCGIQGFSSGQPLGGAIASATGPLPSLDLLGFRQIVSELGTVEP